MSKAAAALPEIEDLNEEGSTQVIEGIKECSFFKDHPGQYLKELSSICDIQEFNRGDVIIKQGEKHQYLYFLLNGFVGIYIDGQKVSKLQRKGDLIGEMALINNHASPTTLISLEDSEFLKLDIRMIQQLPGSSEEYIRQHLYKYYAIMLTQKLESSTNRNEQFELVIHQLRETQHALEQNNGDLAQRIEKRTKELAGQNAVLKASHGKLQDLYNIKDFTFEKMNKLGHEYLRPLLEDLKSIGDNPKVLKAVDGIQEIIEFIAPLDTMLNREQIISTKNLLIIESGKKVQMLTKVSLGGTGVNMDFTNSTEEANEILKEKNVDIVVTDIDHVDFCSKVKHQFPDLRVILMSEESDDYFIKLKEFPFINNVISKNVDDRSFTVRNIVSTVTKMLTHDIFGPEKYLHWGTEVKEYVVKKSGQRKSILESMEKYFDSIGVKQSIRDKCKTVTEELLMNMIYDAPVDDAGKQTYNHLDRKTEVNLKDNEQGKLKFATDGVVAVISGSDPFGRLDRSTVVNYLETCLKKDYGSINRNEGKGGAGLGLYQILSSADLVVFNSRPGMKTEVICLFYLEEKQTDQIKRPSLHFFLE